MGKICSRTAMTFFWDANGLYPHFLLNIVIPFVNTLVLRFALERKAAVSTGLNFVDFGNLALKLIKYNWATLKTAIFAHNLIVVIHMVTMIYPYQL